jgi:hypothetical protein
MVAKQIAAPESPRSRTPSPSGSSAQLPKVDNGADTISSFPGLIESQIQLLGALIEEAVLLGVSDDVCGDVAQRVATSLKLQNAADKTGAETEEKQQAVLHQAENLWYKELGTAVGTSSTSERSSIAATEKQSMRSDFPGLTDLQIECLEDLAVTVTLLGNPIDVCDATTRSVATSLALTNVPSDGGEPSREEERAKVFKLWFDELKEHGATATETSFNGNTAEGSESFTNVQ